MITEKYYDDKERQVLLKLASSSIEYGLKHHRAMPIDLADYAEKLRETRACFVTLNIDHQLRGCIGSLEAHRPIAEDVAHNAYLAAFQDPRFPPLTESEFPHIEIHISVLNEPKPMQFTSEADLLKQIRPNIDGLILSENGMRGTFLPTVWESLPDPKQFLAHLKLKAGFPANYWSNTIKVERYQTESIEK